MIRIIATIFFLLMMGCFAQAQDSTQLPSKWSLQQCIDYAKKNNIQVNSLRLSEQTAQQEVLLAKAQRLPGVNGTAAASLTN
ncbi:MAG TPA: TolC family protein, partial [Puia sp.]